MSNDQLTKAQLKDAVQRIVLAQGNVFIRELLREHKIKLGLTKKDFQKNIDDAIDNGTFTQAMIEAWLVEVEGWGNQHVYMYEPPPLKAADARPLIEKSKFKSVIDKPVSYDFPATLSLTSIAVTAAGLSIVWHQSTTGWRRDEAKDYQDTVDGENYEFRAYRERFDRAVVRFEWRFADDYCAILLQLPHESGVHDVALAVVWADLASIGIAPQPLTKLALSKSFAKLSRDPKVVTQNSKRSVAGAFIILGSTMPSVGFNTVEPVRNVFKTVDDSKFKLADGIFAFDEKQHAGLDKLIKLQGYGEDSRLRIWVQCKRNEIFYLLRLVHDHSQ